MNINSIASQYILPYTLSLVGGYVLNKVNMAIIQIAEKYLKLPITIQEGKNYKDYVDDIIENEKKDYDAKGIDFDRGLGRRLYSGCVIAPIREEIAYRYLLETIVLPMILPKFGVFSIERTCISTILFASVHLHNPYPSKVLAAQFCHTTILGFICSLAQERFGLISSIFIHMGYNLNASQYKLNLKFSDMPKKIKAMHLTDFISFDKINTIFFQFIGDILSPFILLIKI